MRSTAGSAQKFFIMWAKRERNKQEHRMWSCGVLVTWLEPDVTSGRMALSQSKYITTSQSRLMITKMEDFASKFEDDNTMDVLILFVAP